jgi:hypothetical protein
MTRSLTPKHSSHLWFPGGLLAIALVYATFIFARWLYHQPLEIQKQSAASALFSGSTAPGKPISAQLFADTNKTIPGGTVSVWLNLTNTSQQELGVYLVAIKTPGFNSVPLPTIASPLRPNSSATIPLTLSPNTDHGQFRITVAYGWTNQPVPVGVENREVRDAVSIGPIEIGTEERQRALIFLQRITALFKDLTLPIVLAALAALFQAMQTTRDRKQKEVQEVRDRQYQVWASILPRFHQLSEKYYLPIVGSLRNVLKGVQTDTLLGDDDAMMEYLYEFLLLVLRMTLLRDEKGQMFFNNRPAEMLVSSSWRIFKFRMLEKLSTAEVDAALRLLKKRGGTYLDFRALHENLNNCASYAAF